MDSEKQVQQLQERNNQLTSDLELLKRKYDYLQKKGVSLMMLFQCDDKIMNKKVWTQNCASLCFSCMILQISINQERRLQVCFYYIQYNNCTRAIATVHFSQNRPCSRATTLPNSHRTLDAQNVIVFCGQGSSYGKAARIQQMVIIVKNAQVCLVPYFVSIGKCNH